jgi:hypothetical protein
MQEVFLIHTIFAAIYFVAFRDIPVLVKTPAVSDTRKLNQALWMITANMFVFVMIPFLLAGFIRMLFLEMLQKQDSIILVFPYYFFLLVSKRLDFSFMENPFKKRLKLSDRWKL